MFGRKKITVTWESQRTQARRPLYDRMDAAEIREEVRQAQKALFAMKPADLYAPFEFRRR